ncbi:MAG TPA: cupredoxin domain-containing protein, partial [Dehalococcoidia bacterium]|nr:cupredoxin domain-containing protein [Dehalococcoidia bacterium]
PTEDQTFRNGHTCPDGQQGVVQVFVDNGSGERKLDNVERYIPQDGDTIRIVFGPEEQPTSEQEGIQIPADQATRELSVEASDRGQPERDSFFLPNVLSIQVNETVKINVKNAGQVTHNLRLAGVDGAYGSTDDFVTSPLLLEPGEEGFVVVRFDQPGQYFFRCDIHAQVQTGVLNVTSSGTPAPGTAGP